MSFPKIDVDSLERVAKSIRDIKERYDLPPLPRVIWVDPKLPGEFGRHFVPGEYEWQVSEAWVAEVTNHCLVVNSRRPTDSPVGWLNCDGLMVEIRRKPLTGDIADRLRFCARIGPVPGGDGWLICCSLPLGHDGNHDGERQGVTCEWDSLGRIVEASRSRVDRWRR